MEIKVAGPEKKMVVPDKPIIEERNLVGHDMFVQTNRLKVIVTARWYQSAHKSAHTVYCCVWVYGKDGTEVGYRAGSGNAGGYGYCKRSAAFAEALSNAGLSTGFDNISGAGMYAVEDAMKSIGNLLGYDNENLIVVGG